MSARFTITRPTCAFTSSLVKPRTVLHSAGKSYSYSAWTQNRSISSEKNKNKFGATTNTTILGQQQHTSNSRSLTFNQSLSHSLTLGQTRSLTTKIMANSSFPSVVIVSASRTPIGSYQGALASVSATQLGTTAVKHALEKISLDPKEVEEVFIGQVLQAGSGQSPARQVALGAGIPESTDATTINKVCASGMKAIIIGTQQLQLGLHECVVAGGMESMSQSPLLYPRVPATFGNITVIDSMSHDGLQDAYGKFPMGNCAEHTAAKHSVTREEQDAHAIESYTRAANAWKAGKFDAEIAPVTVKGRKGDTIIKEDEEYKKVFFDKIPGLKPVFKKEGGTVTAANASTLNDGASAVVLMTEEKAKALGLKPLAKILGYADAAAAPIDFPTAPTLAIPKALKQAGLEQKDISLFELNEAFSVVVRAAEKIMNIDPAIINVNGGAVALGHPIGSSGSRIVVTLLHALQQGQYGVAGICNGGGAASALVIQKL